MTPDERARTRDALCDCIARQQERAPKPLALLDPSADTLALFQTLFRAAANKASPSEFDIAVAGALAYLVDAPAVLDLLEHASVGDGGMWITGAAMDGLITAHACSNASARLARLVRMQVTEHKLQLCAYGLLQRHGWHIGNAGKQEETLLLLDDLMSDDASARDAALLKVLKAPVHQWPWWMPAH